MCRRNKEAHISGAMRFTLLSTSYGPSIEASFNHSAIAPAATETQIRLRHWFPAK